MKNSLQVASFFVKLVLDRCVFSNNILSKKGYAKELRNARGYPELQRSCTIRLRCRTKVSCRERSHMLLKVILLVSKVSGVIFPPWPFCKMKTIRAVEVDYVLTAFSHGHDFLCQYTSSLDLCQIT